MKQGEVDIRLLRVAEVPDKCSLNRSGLRHYQGTPIGISLNIRVVPSLDKSMLSMSLTVIYDTTRRMMRERLLTYTVSADFEVDSLREHVEVSDADIIVSRQLMILMLSVTIGTLRGMLALRTASTVLADHPLPIMNVSEIVSRIYYGSDVDENTRPLFNFVYN